MLNLKKLLLGLLLVLLFPFNSFAQSNYQNEIKSASSIDQLMSLHKKLEDLLKQEPSITKLNYWLSYDEYCMAMLYEQNGEDDLAEGLLDEGIERLENLSNKDSEDYALLSLLQCANIKHAGLGRIILAKKMSRNSKRAIVLDDRNLRAYVVAGIIDLLRPKIFGGGKVGESYLLKALNELPSQNVESDLLPSWGKEEAYEILILYYLKLGRKEEAAHLFAELKESYPKSLCLAKFKFLIRD